MLHPRISGKKIPFLKHWNTQHAFFFWKPTIEWLLGVQTSSSRSLRHHHHQLPSNRFLPQLGVVTGAIGVTLKSVARWQKTSLSSSVSSLLVSSSSVSSSSSSKLLKCSQDWEELHLPNRLWHFLFNFRHCLHKVSQMHHPVKNKTLNVPDTPPGKGAVKGKVYCLLKPESRNLVYSCFRRYSLPPPSTSTSSTTSSTSTSSNFSNSSSSLGLHSGIALRGR